MSESNSSAPLNICCMLVTAAVFHLLPSVLMALLNFFAFMNMPCMLVTAFVSQSLMSWLKIAVFENMLAMVVTAPVSQLVMSALKAEALRNMESILVTAVVFHLLPSVLMALLNFAAPLNISLMSVTAFVSQSLMSASKSVVPPPPENISDILVTAVVFHLLPSVLMALLNFFAPLNMELMS